MATPYQSMPAQDLIDALEKAGRTPDPELIRACLGRCDEIRPGLLDMLERGGENGWHEEDPRWYRDIHAGLLLIELRDQSALPVFEQILRDPQREVDVVEWYDTWLPEYGSAITPILIRVATDETVWQAGRTTAIEMLGLVGQLYPDEAPPIISVLRDMLPAVGADGRLELPTDPEALPYDDIERWTWVVGALRDLRDADSACRIALLYDADVIDQDIAGPREAVLGEITAPRPEEPSVIRNSVVDFYERLQEPGVLSDEELAELLHDELLRAGVSAREAEQMRRDMFAALDTSDDPADASGAPAGPPPTSRK